MHNLPMEGFTAPAEPSQQEKILSVAPDLQVLMGGRNQAAQDALNAPTLSAAQEVAQQLAGLPPAQRATYDASGNYVPTPLPQMQPQVPVDQPQSPAPVAAVPQSAPAAVGPTTEQLLMQQNHQLIALLAQQEVQQNSQVQPDPMAQMRERVNEVAAKWGVDPQDMTYMLDPVVQPLTQQTAQVEAQVRAMAARDQVAQQYPEAIEKAAEIAAYIQTNPALDQNIASLWQNGQENFALQTAYFAWKAANPGMQQQVTAQQEQTRVNEAAQAQIIGRGGERLTLPPTNSNALNPQDLEHVRGAYKMGYSNPLAQVFLSNLAPHEKALLGMQ